MATFIESLVNAEMWLKKNANETKLDHLLKQVGFMGTESPYQAEAC